MSVDPISCEPESDGARNVHIEAASKSEEQFRIGLMRMWNRNAKQSEKPGELGREVDVSLFVNSSKTRADKERNFLELADIKLRSGRERIGLRFDRHMNRIWRDRTVGCRYL